VVRCHLRQPGNCLQKRRKNRNILFLSERTQKKKEQKKKFFRFSWYICLLEHIRKELYSKIMLDVSVSVRNFLSSAF
jgi:hypothetical protein